LAFRGTFDYSLDAKNRLTVPTEFRAAFADGIVLAKWLEPCISIWTPGAFEAWTDSFLSGLNPLGSQHRKLTRFFAGGSFDIKLDSAGRVTLNEQLIRYAGISKEVSVVGQVNHLEVWDRRRWQEDQEALPDEILEIAESLGHPS
jgi:MraZ protein